MKSCILQYILSCFVVFVEVLLIVNVASECGYTDHHYRELVNLHQQLAPTGHFNVLAFPCNQFGGQEPQACYNLLL